MGRYRAPADDIAWRFAVQPSGLVMPRHSWGVVRMKKCRQTIYRGMAEIVLFFPADGYHHREDAGLDCFGQISPGRYHFSEIRVHGPYRSIAAGVIAGGSECATGSAVSGFCYSDSLQPSICSCI